MDSHSFAQPRYYSVVSIWHDVEDGRRLLRMYDDLYLEEYNGRQDRWIESDFRTNNIQSEMEVVRIDDETAKKMMTRLRES